MTGPFDLESLRIFVKVAELASFTRAAEQLGLTKARVSTGVQQLERTLGTRLLQRTTRTVRPTIDGEQLLERGRELLAGADELQALFQHGPGALRGRLRVDLPTRMARNLVIPRLPEFLEAHPQLTIELSTTDRRVDLIQEGFDCVLRVGPLADSNLIARRLGVLPMVNCASPAYLQRHGVPRTLADLASHRLVHYASTPGWEYVDADGVTRHVPMPGVITVNDSDAYEAACLAGLGLIQVPLSGAAPQVAAGRLVTLLPDFVGAPMPVSLLYAHRRHLPKRAEALMSWLADVIGPHLEAGHGNDGGRA